MSIINQVSEFLQREGLDVAVLEEDVAIRTSLEGENGEWMCNIELVHLSDEVQVLGVISYAEGDLDDEDEVVAPEYIPAGIELANYININGMLVGNFEIDTYDNVWRLRTSVAFNKDGGFSEDAMRHVCFINWMEMDNYFPFFAQVLLDGADVSAVVEVLEEDRGDEEE